MDNSHTNPTSFTDAQFSTTGQDANSKPNSIGSHSNLNNLDLSNQAAGWGASPERNPRNIGGTAISVPEDQNKAIEVQDSPSLINNQNAAPQMGEIVNLEMPPTIESDVANQTTEIQQDSSQKIEVQAPANTLNLAAFRANKDNISDETVKATKNAIEKYKKTDNPTEFYADYEEMVKAYLKNSYGREIAT